MRCVNSSARPFVRFFSTNAPKTSIKTFDDCVRIIKDGETYDFHYFWLYHNCDSWRHPQTRERTIDVSDIELSIKPRKIDLFNEVLYLVWPQQKISEFRIDWLIKHNYSLNRAIVEPPSNDVKLLEVFYDKVTKKDYNRLVRERINKYGAVVVRNRGLDTEDLIKDFVAEGEDVWHSHFGRIEDLKTDNQTNQNTDQLGYTNVGIAPHTDMPFIEEPPSMQILQGIQAADRGGESYLVDARQAALYLKELNPWAFDMLKTVKVKFHRKQKNFTAVTHYPIIQTMGDHIQQIRYSYFTMDPFRVPFEWMRLWYEAYNQFAKILSDPKYQYRFLLNSGDFVLYSNRTMVHAREAFSGSRHVRGIYIDQERTLKHLEEKD